MANQELDGMDARHSELLVLIQENRRVHCTAVALRHEVRQTHSSQSRIPYAPLFGNRINTNKSADDKHRPHHHEFSQLSQYLFSHLSGSGISQKMSHVFREALERASNPKMPPPKSPTRTPMSPSRTSSMFQGKIEEAVITIPGMQNAISHLQIHPKSSTRS